ncbi:glucosaminidase domain-containing protein [Colwellia sp. E2M01]|uniref:glucosaminidase domain-containing protein n=1 Tax=Colwellia sp. E2M01 TaxID=2841561 RepID=UPI002091A980|nr:glucosaminidase domain-containing protein [Colwellia sp. E2M01]
MMLFVRFILVTLIFVALVAPFTFLKPDRLDNNDTVIIKEVTVDLSSGKPVTKITRKKQGKTKPAPKAVEKEVIIEAPLHQVKLPDFSAISDIPTKKRQFFSFIRPAVEAKNKELKEKRNKLEYWHEQISLGLGLTAEEAAEVQSLVTAYRVNESASLLQQINDLLMRVDVIPTSLVLVQAANESAWGTSRFARVGLNFFGIWCYKRGCGMVPNGRDSGAKHEVAAFQSVDSAISGYFNNINTHNAYHVFRIIRAELRAQDQPLDAEVLATGLLPYSQRGAHYVLELTDMLRHNKRYFAQDNQS